MKTQSAQNHYEKVRCLLFDLDNTLYPHNTGLTDHLRTRIKQFLVEMMGITFEEASALRQRLFTQYGTTLRGLQIEHKVEMKSYLDFIHDLPLEACLSPDPELDRMLRSLPHRKVIFTNADRDHAQRVIEILGIQGHFDQIVDIYDVYPYCKPEIEAFHKALAMIEEDPKACLMADDMLENLVAAQTLGIKTVSVGQHQHDASPHIPDIKALARLFSS